MEAQELDLEIEISPAHLPFFKTGQNEWSGDSPEVMQRAVFAGHEMMAIQKSDNEPDQFELYYLGLVGKGFQSMEQAKELAPAFAAEVFASLANMIPD